MKENNNREINVTYMGNEKYHKDIYMSPDRNFFVQTIPLATFDSNLSAIYFMKEENKKLLNKKCDIFILDSSYGLSDTNSEMIKQIIARNESLYNKPIYGIYVYNFFLDNDFVQMANLYCISNGKIYEKEEIMLPKDTHGLDLLDITLLEIKDVEVKQKIKK